MRGSCEPQGTGLVVEALTLEVGRICELRLLADIQKKETVINH
jgi:hypothetical protein